MYELNLPAIMNPSTTFEDPKIDGQSKTNDDLPHVNGSSVPLNRPVIAEQPIHAKRELRVVCAGAGMAGLTLAYVIQHTEDYHSFVTLCIYDKQYAHSILLGHGLNH